MTTARPWHSTPAGPAPHTAPVAGDPPETAHPPTVPPAICRHTVRMMGGFVLVTGVSATAGTGLRTPVAGRLSIAVLLLVLQAALTGWVLLGHALRCRGEDAPRHSLAERFLSGDRAAR
ncbi:hypothetical protein AB0890_20590 [Streptomyces sp. NPDC005406]|uniref:hypothetical protein n=1 Tax=Streptomyces sp. NPDC005406 TaxID=3155339 RepID=UPI003452F2EF